MSHYEPHPDDDQECSPENPVDEWNHFHHFSFGQLMIAADSLPVKSRIVPGAIIARTVFRAIFARTLLSAIPGPCAPAR
jgi:hypothetical protein